MKKLSSLVCTLLNNLRKYIDFKHLKQSNKQLSEAILGKTYIKFSHTKNILIWTKH